MRIVKIALITIFLVVLLFFALGAAFIARVPSRILSIFNSVTIEETKQLAKDCRIKLIGIGHAGPIEIVLIDGSGKWLDRKYEDQVPQILTDSDCKPQPLEVVE